KVVMALMLLVTLGACGSEDATALEAIEYNKQYESLSFSNLDIPVHVEEIDGITYADGVLIVNKEIPLPNDYNPGLQAETEEAYLQMFEDAAAEGLSFELVSGSRAYDYQAELYNNYVARSVKEAADKYTP